MFDKLSETLSCYSTIWRTISRNLRNKKFESEVTVLDQFVGEGGVSFDIGAAYGRYAIHFSRLVGPTGRVFCFEPGSYSHKVIRHIIRFHKLNNITLIKKAVSDQKGEVQFAVPKKDGKRLGPSLAHMRPEGASAGEQLETVVMTTLDDVFREEQLKRLDFIKCDIEGAEMKMLQGARNTIERFKPAVLCEVDLAHLKKFGSSPEDMFGYFHVLGYGAYIFKDGALNQVRGFEGDHNYFFVMPDRMKI